MSSLFVSSVPPPMWVRLAGPAMLERELDAEAVIADVQLTEPAATLARWPAPLRRPVPVSYGGRV